MDGFWAWALLSSFGDQVTVPAERAFKTIADQFRRTSVDALPRRGVKQD